MLKADLARKHANENFPIQPAFPKGNIDMCFNQVMPSFINSAENFLATKRKFDDKRLEKTCNTQKPGESKTKTISFSVESIIGKQ